MLGQFEPKTRARAFAQPQLPLEAEPSSLDLLLERMTRVQPEPPIFGSSVGCSRATGQKHAVYSGVMAWLTTMFTPLARDFGCTFLCAETHAGPGWYVNKSTGVLTVGSPLIDLDVLDRHRLFADRPYRAIFCERGKSIADQLERSIRDGGFGTQGQVDVLRGSFEDTLPALVESLPARRTCGVLFADANGSISHTLVELFGFQQLAKVDLVLWHQARVRNRFLGLQQTEGAWRPHLEKYDYRPLRDILPDFRKQRWLIREPFNAGGNTLWTMLIGSNMPNLRGWQAQRLFELESLKGQEILGLCDSYES